MLLSVCVCNGFSWKVQQASSEKFSTLTHNVKKYMLIYTVFYPPSFENKVNSSDGG